MKKFLFPLLLTLLFSSNLLAQYRHESKQYKMTAFYNSQEKKGFDAMLKGKIISLSTSGEISKDDLVGGVQPRTKVTVRIFYNQDVEIDDELLVINNKNIVVSRFIVKNKIHSKTFGTMVIGYGNLILSRRGFRVVKKVASLKKGAAYIYIARGRFFVERGDKGRAIENFKKAIELESNNPAAHLNLGLIYYRDGIHKFAYHELKKAYSYINRLYDNNDRFTLLKTLATIRFIETYDEYNIMKNKIRFRDEGILHCKEALKLNSESAEILYLLAEFYYRDFDKKDDVLAKKTLMQLLKVDKGSSKGMFMLAKLYLRNGNRKKAVFWARKALSFSPTMEDAREFVQRYE